jgi:hypothetical protein
MKQPDRFARVVERLPHYMTVAAMRNAIPKLLRIEHKAVVRLVKKLYCNYANAYGVCEAKDKGLCVVRKRDILAALKARAR